MATEESKNNARAEGEAMDDKSCKVCMACPYARSACPAGKMCACGCGCGWASGHRIFRVVLAILIALVIFWIGVKVGEFSTMFGDYGRMGGYGWHQSYPMMGDYGNGGGYGAGGYAAPAGAPASSSSAQQ